jgi:Ulp1 family protease
MISQHSEDGEEECSDEFEYAAREYEKYLLSLNKEKKLVGYVDDGHPKKKDLDQMISQDSEDGEEECLNEFEYAAREYEKFLLSLNKGKTLIGHIDSVPVFEETINQLGEKRWINDDIIGLYLKLLVKTFQLEPIMEIVTSHWVLANSLRADVFDRTQNKLAHFLARLDQALFIVVPINTNNNHWTLLVVDVNQRVIMYIDSDQQGDTPSVRGNQVIALVKTFLRNASPKQFDHLKQLDIKRNTKQNGGFDCGVFVCWYVKALVERCASGEIPTNYEEVFSGSFDVLDMRNEIKSLIMENLITE